MRILIQGKRSDREDERREDENRRKKFTGVDLNDN